jgi:hypothetical protein
MIYKSLKERRPFRKLHFLVILCSSSLLALPIQAQNSIFPRWNPQISAAAGYASPAGLEGLKKVISRAGYRGGGPGLQEEEEEEEEHRYRPIGLSLKITGNLSSFSGGDLGTGSAGMFDQVRDYVTSLGYVVQSEERLPFHSGYGFAGEIIYDLNPRLGIGFAVGRFHAYKQSTLMYSLPPTTSMGSIPDIGSTSLKLELRYALPLHRVLAVLLSGGPEFHFVKFKYSRNYKLSLLEETIDQSADASGLGFQGSLGLEVSLNPRLALVLEGQGRYARITNFKGEERLYRWENFQSSDSKESGYLYFVQEGNAPGLAILSQEPGGGNAERAVFDFSGVGFSAGLRFKF